MTIKSLRFSLDKKETAKSDSLSIINILFDFYFNLFFRATNSSASSLGREVPKLA
jgi:hypothetical protein